MVVCQMNEIFFIQGSAVQNYETDSLMWQEEAKDRNPPCVVTTKLIWATSHTNYPRESQQQSLSKFLTEGKK